jgi:predicted amidohydrolase YtcJ
MRDRMMKADAAGLQICTHAIGDEGISTILDLYTDVIQAHGDADRRFRIEHAQHMAAKDFERFAQLHVIASVQPYHAIDDGRFAESHIGHDRASRTYAFRTFLDHGVRLAFGTDWEVAPLNPLLGVYAAVTRATLDDKNPNGWFPEQKLTVAEAVEAYTMGSAYAEFQEKEKGFHHARQTGGYGPDQRRHLHHCSRKNPRCKGPQDDCRRKSCVGHEHIDPGRITVG